MRYPHPLAHWIALGLLLLVGVLHAIRLWPGWASETSAITTVLLAAIVALTPLLLVVGSMVLFGCVMLYLWTFRPGNRVRITYGEHAGAHGTVTKRHGLTTPGGVHVRIGDADTEVIVSFFDCKKIGWKSFVS